MVGGVYFFVETVLGLAIVVLSLSAVVSVVRSQIHRLRAKILWGAFVLCVPIAGAVLWFFNGREIPAQTKA